MFSLALEVSFGGGALRRWEGAPPPAGGLYIWHQCESAPSHLLAPTLRPLPGPAPPKGTLWPGMGKRMMLSAGPSPTLCSLTRAHRGARNPRAGTGDEGLESSWQFLAAL